jgi:flavin reductase (DIM6/NTAB) family NADH-FMN oxidoreductase RutF
MSESHLPGVDPDDFKAALGRWASGITVVTAAGPEGPVGLTVSAFSSLSLHPPLVLVCIGMASWTHDSVVNAPGFGVHILAADQEEVSNTFAFSREDRFKDLPWEGGHHDVPMLGGALARLVCERHQVVEAGDHRILIGRVLQADVTDADPLAWWKGGYRQLAQ